MVMITYGSAALALLMTGYFVGCFGPSYYRIVNPGNEFDIPCNELAIKKLPAQEFTKDTQENSQSSVLVSGVSRKVTAASTATYNDLSEIIRNAEKIFETTMRSCLGKFCFDDPVKTNSGEKLTRIGLLIPDGIGSDAMLKMIEMAGVKNSPTLEVSFTSNVPPYGYGKNHGWSRIIRIGRRIIPNAISLLLGNNSPGMLAGAGTDTKQNRVTSLIEPQVQQLMRWHCRLSHVAAHTSMLTVFTDDFLERPVAELERLVSFIGYKSNRAALMQAIETHLPALQKAWDDDIAKQHSIDTARGTGSIAASAISQWYDLGLKTMRKEMVTTNNLSKWPCKNFRDYSTSSSSSFSSSSSSSSGKSSSKSIAEALPLSVKSLAANCEAPYVKCSVRYDQQEFKLAHPR